MRGFFLGGVLVCSVLATTGCKKQAAKEVAKKDVAAKSFWPDAPKPTKTDVGHAFKYSPENITGYAMTATGGTPVGSGPAIDFKMAIDLAMKTGAAPNIRDAYIRTLDLDVKAPGNNEKMHLDGQVMTVKENAEDTVEFKRGDDGPIDVGGMTDQAFTTLEFTPDNKVVYHSIDTHPFNALGGEGANDMLDNALVLFPALPAGEIKPGHTWKATHRTSVGATSAKVDLEYEFTYVGDGACPSGAASCALFAFTGESQKDATVHENGITMTAGYGLAGKVYFDLARNAPDESRVRMHLDAKTRGIAIKLDATYIVKPTKS
ncbi:MAG: hypothetical protein HOV81_26220 [Kofleriaceae bacterium]|nr:hypothetical protein [Kofleriaceae bacterium]